MAPRWLRDIRVSLAAAALAALAVGAVSLVIRDGGPAADGPEVTATPSQQVLAPTPTPSTAECLPSPAPLSSPPVEAAAVRGRIAFMAMPMLSVMRPDRSELKQLAPALIVQGASSFGEWSPDGQRLAFLSSETGRQGIHVINADGTGLAFVTGAEPFGLQLAWSPDGNRIAFSHAGGATSGFSPPAIIVVSAEGSDRHVLTDPLEANLSPAWSPDGSQIVFVSRRDGNDEIYLMNADGSGQTRLTDQPLEDVAPSWSPDGKHVLFLSNRDLAGGPLPGRFVPEVYVMDVNGSRQTNLTGNAAHDDDAVWSPGGDRIAFVSDRDGNAEVYVMEASGANLRRITANACADSGQ